MALKAFATFVGTLLAIGAVLLAYSPNAVAANEHFLPFVTSASNNAQQGFVRILNNSFDSGSVDIHAIDDTGREYGPVTLFLEAKAAAQFNSYDLEFGNSSKGLIGGTGSGTGDWRLILRTELDIEPLVYIRTSDGFVTPMHDVARRTMSMGYHVPFFNPGSNREQQSRLRIINRSESSEEVRISGLDDGGSEPPSGDVRFTLEPRSAATVTAQQLESGASGLEGHFGDGRGKWQLFVYADESIVVMNLLESPTGHLANLSRERIGSRIAIPLFLSASNDARQGFARIINYSEVAGTVDIFAVDERGSRYGPVTLNLEARATSNFNSADLEMGNESKGLSGSVRRGYGDWRLELRTDLDIEPLAYIRTADGFVTTMHDVALRRSLRYHVPIFNPASNVNQKSTLRLINPTGLEVSVLIEGLDDQGNEAPDGPVNLILGEYEVRTISAEDLEVGTGGLDGSFGDGAGKWQLFVSTDRAISVMSVLESPTGHLTNLSRGSKYANIHELVASYGSPSVVLHRRMGENSEFIFDIDSFHRETGAYVNIDEFVTAYHDVPINGIADTYGRQRYRYSISCRTSSDTRQYDALMLYDRSGSMAWNDPLDLSLDAGRAFIQHLGDGDRALIAQFYGGASLRGVLDFITPEFTNDVVRLSADIRSVQAPNGSTPLWDAMVESIDRFDIGSGNSNALVAFSDGEDNASATAPFHIPRIASSRSVSVYSVNLRNSNSVRLDRIAGRTGGRVFSTDDAGDLIAFYRTLGNLLSGNSQTCEVKIGVYIDAPDGIGPVGFGPGVSVLKLPFEFVEKMSDGELRGVIIVDIPFGPGIVSGYTWTSDPVFSSDFDQEPDTQGNTDRNHCYRSGENVCEEGIYVSVCDDEDCESETLGPGQTFQPFNVRSSDFAACRWDPHLDDTYIPVEGSGPESDITYRTYEQLGADREGTFHCAYSNRFGI